MLAKRASARRLLYLRSMWALARKILLHDRVKFAAATAGVSISVLLVLVQVGLYFGFLQTASTLIDHSDADLWVTGQANDNFDFAAPMDDRVAYRVDEIPGVARVEKVTLAFGQIKGDSGEATGVQVVGLDHDPRLLRPWNVVQGDGAAIVESDGIVVDETEYAKLHIGSVGIRREISGTRARVVGLTRGIRSFTTSPFVFTNLASARAYVRMGEHQVTYVLVKAAPGVDLALLKDRIGRIPYVDVYTTPEISERTRRYWSSRTGIGTTLFATAIMGVVVGVVVVGQILYSTTTEHLKEYGTLKAMGARNGDVVRVILYQALISAAAGFVAGGALAFAASAAMRSVNLVVALSPTLVAATAVLTAVMCSGAALLSITKVLRLDPASVFKG
jgi:putative ABC transport system permease protein